MAEATILVVDDDAGFRAYVRAALEPADFRVFEEAEAAAVIDTALDRLPDAILLDWRMPGQSGITTCRRLREQPELAGVRIAMVTGLDDERDRTLARHAGADAFLVKGGNPTALAEQVRRLLAPEGASISSRG
jgi:two-component system phosphate regulon response regulator PhoB